MLMRNVLENKLIDEDVKEALVMSLVMSLVAGLVAGLVASLVGSLVAGLVASLAGSLVVGLVWGLAGSLVVSPVVGLVWGLVAGLVVSLVVGLVWGLVVGMVRGQYGLPMEVTVTLGIVAFIAMEVLYYFANRKIRRAHVSLWYVLGRKLEELGEVLIVVVNGLNVWYVATKAGIDWNGVYEGIKTFGGYLIFIIGALGIIILWLQLNKQVITKKKVKR